MPAAVAEVEVAPAEAEDTENPESRNAHATDA